MWKNWVPVINPAQPEPSEDSFDSANSEADNPDLLVSPRRPPQSPSASPRALLVPEPAPPEEVLASVDRQLRQQRRHERQQQQEAAEEAAAAAAAMVDNQPGGPAPVVNFEDENGVDDARALQEACRNAEKVQWEETDLQFYFQQVEVKMAAVGVRKNFTKFQVLSDILPQLFSLNNVEC